jgi:hypothetical protein
MLLDLRGIVLLIRAATDQESVDGGGRGRGGQRANEETGGEKLPEASEVKIDYACHGRRFPLSWRE